MYRKKPQNWKKHIDFILLDMLSLQIAFLFAYMTRHGLVSPYANQEYLSFIIFLTVVDVAMLILNNTLKSVLRRGKYQEIAQTAKHVILVELVATFFMFSAQTGADYSRIVIYLLGIYYLIISLLIRGIWKKHLKSKYKHGETALYYITTSDRAQSAIETFQKDTRGYFITGICILDKDMVGEEICGAKVTATKDDVLKYLCDKWVDEVYFSVSTQNEYPEELIDSIAEMGIIVHVEIEHSPGSDWHEQIVEKIGNRMVRTIGITMATTRQVVLKRLLDIAGGIAGCMITLLLTVIIGPMIYIKSPGPIFFKQTRIGRHGKPFKMYKFRSMYLDAEERKAELMKENRVKDGMMFKLDYDPRIIGCEKLPDGTIKKGIGNFIRDWSLDEFPQFFNVLKGDLSLCGTRPPTVDEWEKYELRHRVRLAMKPGITGLWQVSGRSNITDFEQVVELDKKYIREWSMGLDFRIILQTIKVVLGKEGSM